MARPEDDAFRALVENYTDFLEILVVRFERRFDDWVIRLARFLATQQPTHAVVNQLLTIVPWNEVTLGYFLDQLAGEMWLAPSGAGIASTTRSRARRATERCASTGGPRAPIYNASPALSALRSPKSSPAWNAGRESR